MKFIEYSNKIGIIKYLSQHKRSVAQLAEKIDAFTRTTLRMVQQLREHGFPITYNRFRYTCEVKDMAILKNKCI